MGAPQRLMAPFMETLTAGFCQRAVMDHDPLTRRMAADEAGEDWKHMSWSEKLKRVEEAATWVEEYYATVHAIAMLERTHPDQLLWAQGKAGRIRWDRMGPLQRWGVVSEKVEG